MKRQLSKAEAKHMKALADKAGQWLKSLGSSEAQVANSLRNHALKGIRHNPGECPIAEGLRHEVRPKFIAVSGLVYFEKAGSCVTMTLPKPCREFMKSFDDGKYPDMERTIAL